MMSEVKFTSTEGLTGDSYLSTIICFSLEENG
jgi:hypothetical protein